MWFWRRGDNGGSARPDREGSGLVGITEFNLYKN